MRPSLGTRQPKFERSRRRIIKGQETGFAVQKGPHGLVNKVEGARVLGWAHDPGSDGFETVVEFILDGQVIESKIASLQRLALVEKGFPPNCGFSATLPLPPGTHTVSARTKESGFELKNSPFTCTISPSAILASGEMNAPGGADARPAETGLSNTSSQAAKPITEASANEDGLPSRLIVGASNIEGVIQSSSGAIFVLGWAIAHAAAIKQISITTPAGGCVIAGSELARSRRKDVEKALSGAPRHKHLGLFGLGQTEPSATQISDGGNLGTATIEFENGISRSQKLEVRQLDDAAFVETVLSAFSALEYNGNRIVESFAALDGGLGDRLIAIQTAHVRRVARGHACERFGIANRIPKATIIVCVYGRPEYQFLQNALFGMGPSAAEYEYIYVCNSPELIDTLHKAAAISHRVYGLSQSVVALAANAGFGTANTIAARYANSSRLLFVNPDVFPRADSWGEAHQAILDGMPYGQTTLFGARLYYSDGSLMHAGMHLDADTGISIRDDVVERRPILRVEHFGKGAPPDLAIYRGTRPVPAVSGALMSVDRKWFESLNGFADEYVFGHYEDADFCLRSLERGVVPYVHDWEFWHLEGKGSTRAPCHDAAATINRWQFTRKWRDKVMAGFPIEPRIGNRPAGRTNGG